MRYVLYPLLLGALAVGVLAMRDATLSTHQPVAADSELAVVVHARKHRGEPTQSVAEMAEAVTLLCRLEVKTDPTGAIEDIGHDDFRFVLRPSLDSTDRRQFRGCLEDWRADGVLLDVVSMVDL
jgi:hypothetical protein